MDITDQGPMYKDAEHMRDEVYLAPGASVDLLYQKIKELKDLDHTRRIKIGIFIEDQEDRENLISLHPELTKMNLKASMKPKKKPTKRKKPKKKPTKRKKPKKKPTKKKRKNFLSRFINLI